MTVRPYILHGSRYLLQLSEKLRPVIQLWSEQWMGEPLSSFKVGRYEDRVNQSECVYALFEDVRPDTWLCVSARTSDRSRQISQLFKVDCSRVSKISDLAESVLIECLSDLYQRLCKSASSEQSQFKRRVINNTQDMPSMQGAGAVLVSIIVQNATFEFICSNELINQIALAEGIPSTQAHPELEPREKCLDKNMLGIEVVLGEVVLSISDLSNLETGDVLALSSRHKDVLALKTLEGKRIADVILGKSNHHYAVQICG